MKQGSKEARKQILRLTIVILITYFPPSDTREKFFRLFSYISFIVQLSDAIKVHKSLRNEQTEAKANSKQTDRKKVEGVEE